ncbi:MAG: FAD-dependent oxidoreductase [Solirubrobacteraceae bacterium]|nr:FAD-dependent oxidoreductase [Solirubrobacteraceae bacterium]
MTESKTFGAKISRRDLMRDAAAAGAAATVAGPLINKAAVARAATGKRVAIMGGGPAGLTVAHELAERGFRVTIYEKRQWGGKCRSIYGDTPGAGGRAPLPGEHGFRFFPGFYHNLPDTMRRIPLAGGGTVGDNFSAVPLAVASLVNAEDLTVPFGLFEGRSWNALTPDLLARTIASGTNILTQLPFWELLYFVERLFVFWTSCEERRYGRWENQSWTQFVKPGGKSAAYRTLLVNGLTRVLVAARPDKASARTINDMGQAFVFSLLGQGNDGAPDRVLNGPTDEVWTNPWVSYLRSLGVTMNLGWEVKSLSLTGSTISGMTVTDPSGTTGPIDADYYVMAVPPEYASQYLTPQMKTLDPQLSRISNIQVDWMNGIQFFMKRNAGLGKAHFAYMSSPWAVTSINQQQFWRNTIAEKYGDGTVQDVLSVCISDWDKPGLGGKTAKQCSPQEVASEVWQQIKMSVPGGKLRDEDLHSWQLDPGVKYDAAAGGFTQNDDRLMINTAGGWADRPDNRTKIPNLYLAGDYTKTNVNLATMEGANESGRKAANAILQDSKVAGTPARTWNLYQPPIFDAAKQLDRVRYRLGLPNTFDVG